MDNKQILWKQFSMIHPLVLARSTEKAKSDGELFDILSTIPDKYPIYWSEKDRQWKRSDAFEK